VPYSSAELHCRDINASVAYVGLKDAASRKETVLGNPFTSTDSSVKVKGTSKISTSCYKYFYNVTFTKLQSFVNVTSSLKC